MGENPKVRHFISGKARDQHLSYLELTSSVSTSHIESRKSIFQLRFLQTRLIYKVFTHRLLQIQDLVPCIALNHWI